MLPILVESGDETLLRSPKSINTSFLSYYRPLYSTKVAYTPLELNSYLDLIDFPRLDLETSEDLEGTLL